MQTRRPLIAGNWKMNLTQEESVGLAREIALGIKGLNDVDVLVAPPYTVLGKVKQALQGTSVLLGAQNMHWEEAGAFTGEISASMLLEVGCTHVILGHSERRSLFQETDEMVARKCTAAQRRNLVPIICIGETLEEREKGLTFQVIQVQLAGALGAFLETGRMPAGTVLAYEPVWAIGTGRTATPEQAQEVHAFVRRWLAEHLEEGAAASTRILYGGSVKPGNIRALMAQPDLDGALVGGASLKAGSFLNIVRGACQTGA